MLKNRFTSLVLAAIVSIATLSPVHAAQRELVIATDTAFIPFEFKQEGSYVGFDLDLWDAIAKEAGLDYRFQAMDFAGIIPGLQTNNIDAALAGIAINDVRKRVIDFSDPYYNSGLTAIVPIDSKINSIEELNGKRIAAKTGTATVDWIKKNLKPSELRLFPNIDNAYMELRAGGVDAAMHDTPNVLYYIKSAGAGKVKTVGQPTSGDQYGIAFAKGSPLVGPVNAALKAIKADGRYAAIYKKWFDTAPPV